jgi:hypothetical protein
MTKNETIGLEETHGLIGNPLDIFNSLGSDIQHWIVWFLGLLALIFLIVTIVSFFGHGAGARVSSIQRDSAGTNQHILGIVSGVITLVLVILAVALAFSIYL